MDELDLLFGRLVEALAQENRLAVPFRSAEVYERLVPYRSSRSKLRVATHQDYEMTVLRLFAGERGYLDLEPADVREAFQREVTLDNPDTAYFRNFPDAQAMVNRIAAERILRGERVYAPPDDVVSRRGGGGGPAGGHAGLGGRAAPSAAPLDDSASGGNAELSRGGGEAGGRIEERGSGGRAATAEPGAAAGRSATPTPPLDDAAATGRGAADRATPAFELEARGTPPQCPYCGGVLPGDRKINFCPFCGQPPSGELRCPACGSEVDVGWAYCAGCGRATGFE